MQIRKARKLESIQPPMTPMIDCTFNLLIFFLLTPSISSTEGYLTTNLPTTSGPVAGKEQKNVLRIKIELQCEGPKGEDVRIVFNDQDLGTNFDALKIALDQKRAAGLAANTPILISPDMGTRHKWVVKGFDAAVAARFTEIHFAVPYQ